MSSYRRERKRTREVFPAIPLNERFAVSLSCVSKGTVSRSTGNYKAHCLDQTSLFSGQHDSLVT